MNNTIKRSLFKLGTLSLSGLMGLSLCAPALSANASRRPVRHHARTTRKAHLTRRERTTLKRNHAKIARIKRMIRNDKTKLYQGNARKLFHQLRHDGYTHNQSVVIIASISRRQTTNSFSNMLRAVNRKDLKKFAKKYHMTPRRARKNFGRRNAKYAPRVRRFMTEKGTQYKLYKSFNRNVMKKPVKTSRKATVNHLRRVRTMLWGHGKRYNVNHNSVKNGVKHNRKNRTRKGKATRQTKKTRARRNTKRNSRRSNAKLVKQLEAPKSNTRSYLK